MRIFTILVILSIAHPTDAHLSELHLILSNGSSLVCNHIRNLAQFFCHLGVVDCWLEASADAEHLCVPLDEFCLEEFYNVHCHQEGNRDKVPK